MNRADKIKRAMEGIARGEHLIPTLPPSPNVAPTKYVAGIDPGFEMRSYGYGVISLPRSSVVASLVGLEHEPRIDPLDLSVRYDGEALMCLLIKHRQNCQNDRTRPPWALTPAQKTAISAWHSAELRKRVSATKEKERNRVLIDLECVDQ